MALTRSFIWLRLRWSSLSAREENSYVPLATETLVSECHCLLVGSEQHARCSKHSQAVPVDALCLPQGGPRHQALASSLQLSCMVSSCTYALTLQLLLFRRQLTWRLLGIRRRSSSSAGRPCCAKGAGGLVHCNRPAGRRSTLHDDDETAMHFAAVAAGVTGHRGSSTRV